MTEREGVTKFQLEFHPGPPLAEGLVSEISTWRDHFKRLHLIGQDPARYEGLGFGNLSRLMTDKDRPLKQKHFLVTGTQTGGLAHLSGEHFSLVIGCDASQNRLVAKGPVPPSSEAITHGVIYDVCPTARWIFHGHSPAIWRQAKDLDLPTTGAFAPYGTPEMAEEVIRLFQAGNLERESLFIMGGHEDGIICFGEAPEKIAALVEAALARSKNRNF